MSDWQSYFDERKIKRYSDYAVIIPEKNKEDRIPVFCDVCEVRLFTKDDEETYKKFLCCSACADMWAYSHKAEWAKGWRPNQQQIEDSIKKRIFIGNKITFE